VYAKLDQIGVTVISTHLALVSFWLLCVIEAVTVVSLWFEKKHEPGEWIRMRFVKIYHNYLRVALPRQIADAGCIHYG
jgi:uncharacterized protein (DUF924 family)